MMGLSPTRGAARFDRVIEFAELEEFVDLKLKNYSSGMTVRLAFSVMIQVDADVLLIDEVLAVGDAAFQQKCYDDFNRLRDEGRTMLLVTHDMNAVNRFCHRAMLLHAGQGRDDRRCRTRSAMRYLELNFRRQEPAVGEDAEDGSGLAPFGGPARIASFQFEDSEGRPGHSFKHGEPIHFSAVIEATEDTNSVCFGLVIRNHDDLWVAHLRSPDLPESGGPLRAGERLSVHLSIDNRYQDGRYLVSAGLTSHRDSNKGWD